MKLDGCLAELIGNVAPEIYGKYIDIDGEGRAILYVKLQKALYGMLKSALLFYKKIVANLKGIWSKVDPYDPCMTNKEINGTQMTRCWHVDDLKVSHKEEREVAKIAEWLKGLYGKIKVSKGKHHDYLGMDFDIQWPEC